MQRSDCTSQASSQLTYLSLNHEAATMTHGLDKVEDVNTVLVSNPLHLTHDGHKGTGTANTSTVNQIRYE